jgi:hypothetical protein
MKALGLSFSLSLFAALAAPPAEAHFRAFFHASPRIGPMHGGDIRGESRRLGRHRDGFGGDLSLTPDTPADASAAPPQPQYVPVPVPVAVPYWVKPWTPSHPRLILIGGAERLRPRGDLPKVVYGDPLP